jgi:hypothetical protein
MYTIVHYQSIENDNSKKMREYYTIPSSNQVDNGFLYIGPLLYRSNTTLAKSLVLRLGTICDLTCTKNQLLVLGGSTLHVTSIVNVKIRFFKFATFIYSVTAHEEYFIPRILRRAFLLRRRRAIVIVKPRVIYDFRFVLNFSVTLDLVIGLVDYM